VRALTLTITRASIAAEEEGARAALDTARPARRRGPWQGGLGAIAAVYFFIAAINLMGAGLKTVAGVPEAKQVMDQVFELAHDPLAGLSVGVLITSLVQSSSFTTTFTVGLVAAGQIDLATAIPIVMGANVGTSVTNILVSLAHLRHRTEFRRSLGGAIVHDLFNVLSVSLFMPLEWKFRIISVPADAFARWLGRAAFFTTSPKEYNIVRWAISPVTRAAQWLLGTALGLDQVALGLVTAALAIVILFAALYFLVRILRGLLRDRLAGLFSRTLFAHPAISFVVGIVTTATVQSSSVTTSLVVPLVGAGVLKIRQIYPYTLGANIGTTVTAILGGLALAATAAGQGDAAQTAAAFGLAVAFGHLLFNILGTAVFWPLQWIPISLAKGYARLAAERRILAAVYLVVIFLVVPVLTIILVNARGFARLLSGGAVSGP
jgi:sodium-dependent phosphate cotransporter